MRNVVWSLINVGNNTDYSRDAHNFEDAIVLVSFEELGKLGAIGDWRVTEIYRRDFLIALIHHTNVHISLFPCRSTFTVIFHNEY